MLAEKSAAAAGSLGGLDVVAALRRALVRARFDTVSPCVGNSLILGWTGVCRGDLSMAVHLHTGKMPAMQVSCMVVKRVVPSNPLIRRPGHIIRKTLPVTLRCPYAS